MYEVVGEFYKLRVRPEQLLREAMEGVVVEREATALSKAIVASYELMGITLKLSNVVREAERFLLTQKVFDYDESWNIRGSIMWSQTARRMALLQAPLLVIVKRDTNTPEYLLLRYTIVTVKSLLEYYCRIIKNSIEENIRSLENKLNRATIINFSKGIKILEYSIKDSIRRIEALEKKTILRHILIREQLKSKKTQNIQYILKIFNKNKKRLEFLIRRRPWKPKWVHDLQYIVENLNNLNDNLKNVVDLLNHVLKGTRENSLETVSRRIFNRNLRLLSWKLYELYTLYILLRALSETAGIVYAKFQHHELYVKLASGEYVTVIYNKPLNKSLFNKAKAIWLDNTGVPSKETILKMRGRPDISVRKNREDGALVVLEAKFSRNLTYLAAAKSKVLAYMYEYQARTGILVYPAPPAKKIIDAEEENMYSILEEAYRRKGLKIAFGDSGHILYLLPITPQKKSLKENIELMKKAVINEILK